MRFGYLHFVYLGPASQAAAEASECAADQDAFWPYHDLLYENHVAEDRKPLTDETLKQFADELQLDRAPFDECLESEKYRYEVQKQSAGAQSLGIRGAPFFFINGETLPGAVAYRVCRSMIERHRPR